MFGETFRVRRTYSCDALSLRVAVFLMLLKLFVQKRCRPQLSIFFHEKLIFYMPVIQ
jgi:hypothetical protein